MPFSCKDSLKSSRSASKRNSAADAYNTGSRSNGVISMYSSQHSQNSPSGPASALCPNSGLGAAHAAGLLHKKMSTASAPGQFLLEAAAARRGSLALASNGAAFGANYGPAMGDGAGAARHNAGDAAKRPSESAITAMHPTIASIEIGGIEITIGDGDAPEGQNRSQRDSRNSSGATTATNSTGYWGSAQNNSVHCGSSMNSCCNQQQVSSPEDCSTFALRTQTITEDDGGLADIDAAEPVDGRLHMSHQGAHYDHIAAYDSEADQRPRVLSQNDGMISERQEQQQRVSPQPSPANRSNTEPVTDPDQSASRATPSASGQRCPDEGTNLPAQSQNTQTSEYLPQCWSNAGELRPASAHFSTSLSCPSPVPGAPSASPSHAAGGFSFCRPTSPLLRQNHSYCAGAPSGPLIQQPATGQLPNQNLNASASHVNGRIPASVSALHLQVQVQTASQCHIAGGAPASGSGGGGKQKRSENKALVTVAVILGCALGLPYCSAVLHSCVPCVRSPNLLVPIAYCNRIPYSSQFALMSSNSYVRTV